MKTRQKHVLISIARRLTNEWVKRWNNLACSRCYINNWEVVLTISWIITFSVSIRDAELQPWDNCSFATGNFCWIGSAKCREMAHILILVIVIVLENNFCILRHWCKVNNSTTHIWLEWPNRKNNGRYIEKFTLFRMFNFRPPTVTPARVIHYVVILINQIAASFAS